MTREAALAALDAHRARVAIDLEPAEAQDLRGATRLPPAQDRAQARQKLPWLERLRKVIVGPHLEPNDSVHRLAPRRQHEDWNIRRGAQPAADFEAVHVRQHQIEHHGVVALALETLQACATIRHHRDAKPRLAEVLGYERGKAGIVVDDQNPGHHSRSLAVAPPPPADMLGQPLLLLRRQHVGHVGEGLGEPPRRLLDELDRLIP